MNVSQIPISILLDKLNRKRMYSNVQLYLIKTSAEFLLKTSTLQNTLKHQLYIVSKNEPKPSTFGILLTNLPPKEVYLAIFLQIFVGLIKPYACSCMKNFTIIGTKIWAYHP